MASTFSTNLNLELQGTGDNVGTWGTTLNAAALDIVDNAMGDTQTFTDASGTRVPTTTQTQVANYVLTSTLVGNVIINWPAIGRVYAFTNNTTGNFTVTLQRNSAGTTVVAPQGRTILIILSSTGVTQLTDAGTPLGQIAAFATDATANLPASVTGWVLADGRALSRTTYAALFSAIGTYYGAGDGSSTFNVPNLLGAFIRGWNNLDAAKPNYATAVGAIQTSANLAHTHTGTTTTNGDHTHNVGTWAVVSGGSGVFTIQRDDPTVNPSQTSTSGAHNHTFTTDSSGGTEARPYNMTLAYYIRVT
jgi:microcystin-dependent protein